MKLAQAIKVVQKVLQEHGGLTKPPLLLFDDEFHVDQMERDVLRIIFGKGDAKAVDENTKKNNPNRKPLILDT